MKILQIRTIAENLPQTRLTRILRISAGYQKIAFIAMFKKRGQTIGKIRDNRIIDVSALA